MSIFGSVSSYFGGSAKHVENAGWYAETAKNAALEIGTTIGDSAYAAVQPKAVAKAVSGAVGGFLSYEWVAGKVVSTNALMQAMKYGASWTSETCATTAINALAAATKFTALSLIESPLGSMATLVGTSILATHPQETLNAVRAIGEVTYNFVKTGANLTAAATEITLAWVLGGLEVADAVVEKVVKPVTKAIVDYTLDYSDALSYVDLNVLGEETCYEVVSLV
jgi:hypothetical protein